jgi:hypothetical protein
VHLLTVVILVVALVLTVAGCGGDGDDSGFSDDEVSNALGLRFEGNDMLYALPSGKDCIVTQILTSSDEVKSAQDTAAGAVDAAVATNPAGDAGVEFGGETGPPPEDCVGPAEADLNTLSAK